MILIIDFGSQTAHLIGRRLRQLGVDTQYVDPEHAYDAITEHNPSGIIFSGGPSSVYEKDAPSIDKKLFTLNIPILGICYGWQLMAHILPGGHVENSSKEYGPETVTFSDTSLPFHLPTSSISAILSHGDTVTSLPQDFVTAGSTEKVKFAAVANHTQRLYGVQFHPEADHTEHGIEVFRQFAQDICGETLKPITLSPESIIERLKQTIGTKKVIMAVSGGVDSTVAAYLIGRAIGKNLVPVYVESGLMRPETDTRVSYIFSELIHADLEIVRARSRFLAALKGKTNPEAKRKIIGKLYVDIFQEIAKKHPEASFLGQGTIYSDVIESKGSTHASRIKSHHNVGGLPKSMKLTLIEPLRQFYKDEVRQLGRLAGLPDEVVDQQPFPGPGHAVNIIGEVTKKRLEQIRLADQIVIDEMRNANLYSHVFECFAVMTGTKSTAVKGDARVHAEVVAVRSYDSRDIMTATWTRIPHEVLARISSRIVNEVPDVSRVVYDITSKPPATMRWE